MGNREELENKGYERIRNLRLDKDWNQTKIAKLLNMSQTGYSKYETGENDIPTIVLKNLAAIHHTSIDYLLGVTDQIKPYPYNTDSLERLDKYQKKIRDFSKQNTEDQKNE